MAINDIIGFGYESINPSTGSYDTLLVVHVGGDPQDLDMEFIVGDADTLIDILVDADIYTEEEGMHLFDATKLADWRAIVSQQKQQVYGHPIELTPIEMTFVTPEQWEEWDRYQAWRANNSDSGFSIPAVK
jgi:hypothetical protein